jgi:CRP/FNR family transcriptional regulator
VNRKEIIQVLSKVPYFAELNADVLNLISTATIEKTCQTGQCIFMEGEPCIGLYVVVQGWLRAVKISATGREQVIRFVGPSDVFNEVGVLTGGVNVVTVETLEPTKLIIVQRETLLNLVDQHPSLAKSLIENLANRVLYAMNMVVDLSLLSVESRLARFLLEEAHQNIISRKKWATQAFIAARIGTVPVVVNRAFRTFVEEEIIDLDRNHIRIRNREALEKIATPEE